MIGTLLKKVYEYRVENEDEVVALIEEHKEKPGLITYKTTYKTKKEKGEIVDEWYVVAITHTYVIK